MSPVNATDWSFNPNYFPPPVEYDDDRYLYDSPDVTYDMIVLQPPFTSVQATDWST